MTLNEEIVSFFQMYSVAFDEYFISLSIDVSKSLSEFFGKTSAYQVYFSEAQSHKSKLLADLKDIKQDLKENSYLNKLFNGESVLLSDFGDDFLSNSQELEEKVEGLIEYRGYNPLETSIIWNFVRAYPLNDSETKYLESVLSKDNIASSSSGFNYLYNNIDKKLFVCKESDNLLFELISGVNDYLFHQNYSSSRNDIGTGYHVNKTEFFVWSLIHLSDFLKDYPFESPDLKSQKAQLLDFVDKGRTSNKILKNYALVLPYVKSLYRQYGFGSIIKFGLSITRKSEKELLTRILKEQFFEESLSEDSFGVRLIPPKASHPAKLLIVDYTNNLNERLTFGDFFMAYALPLAQFKDYVMKGDLFLNSFYLNGKNISQIKDPFRDIEIKFNRSQLNEIFEHNKNSLSKFKSLFQEDQFEFVVKKEKIQPYFSFLNDLNFLDKLIKNTDNFTSLENFLKSNGLLVDNLNQNI